MTVCRQSVVDEAADLDEEEVDEEVDDDVDDVEIKSTTCWLWRGAGRRAIMDVTSASSVSKGHCEGGCCPI